MSWIKEYWSQIIWGLGLLGSVLVYIRTKINLINSDLRLLKESNLASLRTAILRSAEEYINKGYITFDQLENLKTNNEVYKKMGGNGFVKTLMTKIEQLPLKED